MRLLLLLLSRGLVLLAGFWLFRWIVSGALRRTADTRPGRGQPVTTGELKKDPVCGMYVAKETALRSNKGGELHYFCSEECRQAFLREAN